MTDFDLMPHEYATRPALRTKGDALGLGAAAARGGAVRGDVPPDVHHEQVPAARRERPRVRGRRRLHRDHRAQGHRGRASRQPSTARGSAATRVARQLVVGPPNPGGELLARALPHLRAQAGLRGDVRDLGVAPPSGRPRACRGRAETQRRGGERLRPPVPHRLARRHRAPHTQPRRGGERPGRQLREADRGLPGRERGQEGRGRAAHEVAAAHTGAGARGGGQLPARSRAKRGLVVERAVPHLRDRAGRLQRSPRGRDVVHPP